MRFQNLLLAAAAVFGTTMATTTEVYTTTYYYLTKNPTNGAVSPTLLIESVVKSTSGIPDQQTFSTPTGVTVLDLSFTTYTTTFTSTNPTHDAVVAEFTISETVTSTEGLPGTSTSDNAAGRVGSKEVGGAAAAILGLAALYL